jgi:hypothetical protein
MFEMVLELAGDILLALAPNRRDHYVWHVAACALILLSCSACMFIAELAMQSKH